LCAEGMLRLHQRTCERFCREGRIPAIKVGNSWCTTPDAIRAFLFENANDKFKKLMV
jgi:hypothetical protein